MVWKVVAVILNRRITAYISFHGVLHGLPAGCGTGTATLEAKVLQQLAAMMEEVSCVIFLDLHKVYGALYRDRCLEILEGYDVGPRACLILRVYWDRLRMIACAGAYCGTAFQEFRGVTQGDPLSPTIFNVAVDAIVQHWVAVVE